MSLRVRGTIMQARARAQLEVRHDVVIAVDDGVITSIEPWSQSGASPTVDLPVGSVILPGLVDVHIHAPQWPQLGTGLDLPLESWLFEHTFPLEARYSDLDFAAEVWTDMVAGLLAHGTTTAVYYGTVDVASTTLLARTCAEQGQRAFVGRVGMDHTEGTPEWYRDHSASEGVADSMRSIDEIRALGSPLVQPMVTPRFVPACTDALLQGLGELAAATETLIQTHCSESDWEHQYVLDRFGVSDTVALERFGLVQRGTVLAHSNHVSNEDLALMADANAGVGHCPLSNAYFANAVFPARRALAAGVHVGMGTDIAGGSEPGLLGQCAHAVTASRYLEDGVEAGLAASTRGVADSRIGIVEAFWMATTGGAELLGVPVGVLEPGKRFDALVVQPGGSDNSALRRWDMDDDLRYFEKVVRLARPIDISHVWVDGQLVRPS